MFFSKVCKKGVAKKLVGALLLTMSLSVVGCGSSGSADSENTETTESSETTENSENTEENATAEESENVMYRVSEVGEDSITVNEMNFGKGRGERPEGEMLEGTPGEMPEGEMPEGERPEGMPEGEMPEGTPGEMPEGEMPEGERPEGTPGEEMTEEMKEKMQEKMGEEKTILISDDTVIKKENEDGTIETCAISDLAEGDMLSVTGEEADDGISATEIIVKNTQGFGRGGKGMPQGENPNAAEGEAIETEEATDDSQA